MPKQKNLSFCFNFSTLQKRQKKIILANIIIGIIILCMICAILPVVLIHFLSKNTSTQSSNRSFVATILYLFDFTPTDLSGYYLVIQVNRFHLICFSRTMFVFPI